MDNNRVAFVFKLQDGDLFSVVVQGDENKILLSFMHRCHIAMSLPSGTVLKDRDKLLKSETQVKNLQEFLNNRSVLDVEVANMVVEEKITSQMLL